MAKQKENRVALNVMVLPGTKKRIDDKREKRSQGAYVDDLVIGVAQVVETTPAQPVFDFRRVQEWMRDERRLGAAEAFTAGDERQVAYCFEEILARGQEEPLPDFSLSAWARSTLLRFEEQYRGDERAIWDMVVEFFESMGGVCAACSGRLAAIPEGEVAAATSSEDSSTLATFLPGDSRRACLHCGAEFLGARVATICPGCVADGHVGDVRDCGVCATGKSL